MEDNRRLMQPDGCFQFLTAGNTTVTFKSRATDRHSTYKVTKHKTDKIWFVSSMFANQEFKYIGIIDNEGVFRHTRKSNVGADSMTFKIFAWSWMHLTSEALEVWHEGSCGMCGRPLTDPVSIERGFGPTCWPRV